MRDQGLSECGVYMLYFHAFLVRLHLRVNMYLDGQNLGPLAIIPIAIEVEWCVC